MLFLFALTISLSILQVVNESNLLEKMKRQIAFIYEITAFLLFYLHKIFKNKFYNAYMQTTGIYLDKLNCFLCTGKEVLILF